MRTREEVRAVEKLAERGLGVCEIARLSGVPPTTACTSAMATWSRFRARIDFRSTWIDAIPASLPGPRTRFTAWSRATACRGGPNHLDLLGVPRRPAGPRNISIARREGVATLDAFVGPKR
jgi:hypothetical protein